MEQINLTAPITTPNLSDYRVVYLAFDWDHPSITITLRGTNGERKNWSYSGATATTLMVALNKANLSVKSLHRRVIEQLQADGVLVGTIAGSPD